MTDDRKKPTPRNPLPDQDRPRKQPMPGSPSEFPQEDYDQPTEKRQKPDDAGNLDPFREGGDETWDNDLDRGKASERKGTSGLVGTHDLGDAEASPEEVLNKKL
jgi:hypothetical protein